METVDDGYGSSTTRSEGQLSDESSRRAVRRQFRRWFPSSSTGFTMMTALAYGYHALENRRKSNVEIQQEQNRRDASFLRARLKADFQSVEARLVTRR
jgi:hypothetical protein